MTTQVRHPIWFFAVRPAGARTFATLYGLESFARASISCVIPIQAYEILRNEQGVSILYTVVALLGLSATLFMPMLIERFSRRWMYTAGVLSLILGSVFFVTGTLPGQVLGMLARVMGASALAITLNLYIMDHIRKTEVMQAESLRMAWSMLGWTAGPTLGVFLYSRYGIVAPHLVVIGFATVLLVMFWRYRLSDNRADPARQDACLQSACQYRPFRRAAAAEARLAHRLRPLLLLDDLLRLRADPDGRHRRGQPRRRPAGIGRQRAALRSRSIGAGPARNSARATS